nr:MAG TPA: hypothetical protein [Caudoviricetes sp.]
MPNLAKLFKAYCNDCISRFAALASAVKDKDTFNCFAI